MATIKQALEMQIDRAHEELMAINATLEAEISALRVKRAPELDAQYAMIKALKAMIALYDKHNTLLDTISVTPVIPAASTSLSPSPEKKKESMK